MGATCIFPDDLVEEILSRLSVIHLLRLRSVSKSWCALIDSCHFIKKQHQAQYAMLREEGDLPLFMDSFGPNESAQLYMFSKSQGRDNVRGLTNDLSRDSAPQFADDPDLFNMIECMGVVHGIVGLRWRGLYYREDHMGLWNPASREFKVIPSARPNLPDDVFENCDGILGLGFDSKSNDFKVVRSILRSKALGDNEVKSDRLYDLYSLNTNSWEELEGPQPSISVGLSSRDGFFNGFYYWTAFDSQRLGNHVRRLLILLFDFSTEVFRISDPPSAAVAKMTGNCWGAEFALYKDFLSLVINHENSGEAVYCFEIWVVSRFDDNGMPLSWQHLFTIGPFREFYGLWFTTFRMDGDMLVTIETDDTFTVAGQEGCLYNPATCTFKTLDFTFWGCYRYVESLFSLCKTPFHNENGEQVNIREV